MVQLSFTLLSIESNCIHICKYFHLHHTNHSCFNHTRKLKNKMTYVQINIGRGDLDSENWSRFTQDVCTALIDNIKVLEDNVGDVHLEIHDGIGKWGDMPEESRHISVFWTEQDERKVLWPNYKDISLRRELTELCRLYDQDNVAIIESESELV